MQYVCAAPRARLVGLRSLRLTRGSAATLLTALLALGGCAMPPPPQGAPGQIISRLPSNAPGAAAPVVPLTQAEKDRYAQIDKQVMRDQAQRSRITAWENAVAVAPVYYSGYYYNPYPAYPAYYPYAYPYGYPYEYGYSNFSIGIRGGW